MLKLGVFAKLQAHQPLETDLSIEINQGTTQADHIL